MTAKLSAERLEIFLMKKIISVRIMCLKSVHQDLTVR